MALFGKTTPANTVPTTAPQTIIETSMVWECTKCHALLELDSEMNQDGTCVDLAADMRKLAEREWYAKNESIECYCPKCK